MKSLPHEFIDMLQNELESIGSYGSIEIIVQNNVITQITSRSIKKVEYPTHIEYKNTLDVDEFGHVVKRKKV